MLMIINNQVDQQEVEQIIKYFDRSNDMNIQFKEFEYMIMNCEYGMEEKENKMLEKIKADGVIKNLQTKIRLNHVDLKQMFEKLDVSKDGKLSQNELRVLVQQIDNTLTNREM